MALEVGAYVPTGWNSELAPWRDRPADQWRIAREWATELEELGFDLLVVGDHLTDVPAALGDPVLEAWTVLSALAVTTQRIRLGQMALCAAYRHPALLAKAAATLDAVSGGRVELCLGAGWFGPDFERFGIEMQPSAERIAALADTARVVAALFSGEEVSFAGRHHRLEAARGVPRPVQRPGPRLWIAGSGPTRTLRVTAEVADVANFGGPPDEFAAHAHTLQSHCEAVGRDPGAIALSWSGDCVVRETEAEIEALFARGVIRDPRRRSYEAWAPRYLVGTPEQVAERAHALVDAGCSIFVPWFSDAPDRTSLRLFAAEVLPRLRSRSGGA